MTSLMRIETAITSPAETGELIPITLGCTEAPGTQLDYNCVVEVDVDC